MIRRRHLLFPLTLAAGAAAVVLLPRGGDALLGATRERIALLRPVVEEQRAASERAALDYVLKLPPRLDDLAADAKALLQHLPGVVQVEVLVSSDRPRHRLVHLRDYHLVPSDMFAAEARHLWGRELSEGEVDALHAEHLLWVELVQLEQGAVLRRLAKHHALRQLFSEGMVEGEAAAYRQQAVELHEAGAVLRRQLADARGLLKAAVPGSDKHAKASAVEKDVLAVLADHRRDALRLGAPARLLGDGRLRAVLPLDDPALLEKAKPVPGRPVDAVAIRARTDAAVKTALPSGPLSVVVLGGAHDLTESVRKVGKGTVEYLRVTTRLYREAEEKR